MCATVVIHGNKRITLTTVVLVKMLNIYLINAWPQALMPMHHHTDWALQIAEAPLPFSYSTFASTNIS